MFTVCPKCTLTLVVTTVDLRAGQGYVRCGRCANVFNALVALREGDPNAGTSDAADRRLQETRPPVNPAVGAGVAMDLEPEPEPEIEPEAEPEIEPEPESELQPEEVVYETLPEEASLEFDAVSTDVSEIFISADEAERAGSGTYETVVLGEDPGAPLEPEPVADDVSHTDTIAADEWSLLDDDPPADAESVIEESPLAEIEPPVATANATGQADPPWVEEMFAEAEAEAERSRTAEQQMLEAEPLEEYEPPADEPPAEALAAASASEPSDASLEPLLRPAAAPRPQWQQVTAVALLVLALGLQVIHFNRQSLVLSGVGPAVSTAYSWLGVKLVPRWDLGAYSVKQLGAEAEGGAGTQLRVRLSVHNESDRVQPLPLVRLTLKDRFDNPVATRDLEPRDYLPRGAASLRLLDPDQRIDAEVHVIDPGRAAEGFELDACLRDEGGTIGCANDVRRRTAG
jgi:predicted Zn finger-like uncharacterized protein